MKGMGGKMRIADIPAAAAERLISEKDWIQGDWETGAGECMHQAVRMCAPHEADGLVVSAYLTAIGHGTGWNDHRDTTRDDVLAVLKGVDLTDDELLRVFGPQALLWVDLVRAASELTADQVQRLGVARDVAWGVAWSVARDVARGAAGSVARDVARGAAWALICRDLIGDTFTQAHYDLLTGPWRTVVGPIHPDDEELTGR